MFAAVLPYSRQDCLLEPLAEKKIEPLPLWKRVAYLSMPLLSLDPLGAKSCALGMGGYQIVILFSEGLSQLQKKEYMQTLFLSVKIMAVASGLFLSFSCPLLYSLTSTTIHLVVLLWKMRQIKDLEKKEMVALTFQLLANLIYLGAQIEGSWEASALSLLFQGLEELQIALSENHLPEALVHAFVGVFRLAQAKPFALRFYRDQFGRELSQAEWEAFYHEWQGSIGLQENPEALDIDAILSAKGISGRIHNLDFTRTKKLSHITATYLKFSQCNFSDIFVDKAKFHFCRFSECNFKEMTCIHSIFSQCILNRCDLSSSFFVRSQFTELRTLFSNLQSACFNASSFSHSLFAFSNLQETNFLDAEAKKSLLWSCDLQDALLLSAKKGFISLVSSTDKQTKPVIALPWDFYKKGQFSPLIAKALKDNGANVLFLDGIPEEINPEKLNEEVELLLAEISKEEIPQESSRTQELLKRAPPDAEIKRLINQVERLTPFIQGISIPGNGYDVHPELYGRTFYGNSHPAPDYRKEIFELALIRLGERKKIPVMGTCRGAQLIDVWRGGDLKDHIANHFFVWQNDRFSDSSLSKELQLFLGIKDASFIGYSAHHQGIQNLGRGMHVILSFSGIPKMIASEDGMLFGSQIHPEYYSVLRDHVQSLERKSPLSPDYPDTWKKIELYKKIINNKQLIYKWWLNKVINRTN